ncbi:MAG: ABC transporter permease [Myxococcota bacterium]|nr:ABC transporter permease [Myxococcota bacterium]
MSWRLEPRAEPGLLVEAGWLVLAVLVAVLAGALLFAGAGAPPLAALGLLVTEPFGSGYGLAETLVRTVPLACCGLAVAFARQANLWNIGAEGQLMIGALGASWLPLAGPPLPEAGQWPLLLLAGALSGACWGGIAALLRAFRGVNEILSTLMLNYVGISLVEGLVHGPWKGADGFPYTDFFGPGWRLPLLTGRVHAGLLGVIALAVVLHLLLARTRLGLELRVVGAAPETARTSGIPVRTRLVLALTLGGAFAGLAGALEVAGVEGRLHGGLAQGVGYTAILVAFLARGNLLAVLPTALALAALTVGGDGVQMAYPGVSAATVLVFQGLLLLLVLLGGRLAGFRLRRSPGGGRP